METRRCDTGGKDGAPSERLLVRVIVYMMNRRENGMEMVRTRPEAPPGTDHRVVNVEPSRGRYIKMCRTRPDRVSRSRRRGTIVDLTLEGSR